MFAQTNKRYEALDGLRGVAAMAVLMMHVQAPLSPNAQALLAPRGYLAVDFFFVLSGFVIATAYESRLLSTWSFWDFARARVTRLWPLIMMGATLGALGVLIKWKLTGAPSPTLTLGALAAGFLMFPWPFPVGTERGLIYPLNPPAWSLFYEIVANVLYAALIRALSLRVLAAVAAAAATALLAVGCFWRDLSQGAVYSTAYVALARVLFSFTVGVIIQKTRPAFSMPTWAGVALMIAAFSFPLNLGPRWICDFACILILFPTLVASTIEGRGGAICRFGGKLSYPLYATHYWLIPPLSHWARAHALNGWRLCLWFDVEIALALLTAYVAMRVDDLVQKQLARASPKTRRKLAA